jgi:hypothetical protein
MQQYNHFEYGEKLARKLKAIAHTDKEEHFYRATEMEDMQELNARLSGARGMILVAIDGSNSDLGWKDSDSLMERPQYFFVISKQTPGNDVSKIFESQSECKAVALQIIAYMKKEGNSHNPQSPLQFLEEGSITIRGYGPLNENFYGVVLGFNFNYGIDYRIDKSFWLEE